jgi:GMP synthase (glutamine-hydrolysing)
MKIILVLQFRTDDSEAHEQQCFQEILAEDTILLRFVSGLSETIDSSILDEVDGVILGGSGELYLGKGDGEGTWLPGIQSLIQNILERDVPLLGLCFGFQLLALHEGARIIGDIAMQEIGAFVIETTGDKQDDPLFAHATGPFLANVAHKETNVMFPDHLIQLASSERVACHAFRVGKKRAWGILFHPELNKKLMSERYMLYVDGGMTDYVGAGIDEQLSKFQDTLVAEQTLHAFVDIVKKA